LSVILFDRITAPAAPHAISLRALTEKPRPVGGKRGVTEGALKFLKEEHLSSSKQAAIQLGTTAVTSALLLLPLEGKGEVTQVTGS